MLKPRNTAANVITAIAAAIMSILLVILLFGTAVVGTVNSITTPQGLGKVVNDALQNVDFEQIIVDSAEDMDIAEEDLQEARIINRLLKTEAAEEIIDLFSAEITASINREEGNLFNDRALKDIVDEHQEEIVDILCELSPGVDRETVRKEMLAYVDDNAAAIVDSLMSGVTESIGETADIAPILDAVKIAVIVLALLCVVLAGAIYGCRYYRFGGFLWVGIDTAVAGLFTLLTALAIKSDLLAEMLAESPQDGAIITATVYGIGDHFMRTALLIMGLGVLLIGLFILLKCTVVNPKVKAAKAAQLPVEEA